MRILKENEIKSIGKLLKFKNYSEDQISQIVTQSIQNICDMVYRLTGRTLKDFLDVKMAVKIKLNQAIRMTNNKPIQLL